jgi:DNA-binding MltR family transcriptional regulator
MNMPMDPKCENYVKDQYINEYNNDKIDKEFAEKIIFRHFKELKAKDKTWPTIHFRINKKDNSLILTSSLDKQ